MLSEKFLEPYRTRRVPFGEIGAIVFLRTYSRYLPELGRREYWHEVVKRVVEYSCSLGVTFEGEEEELYDAIFNLRIFPAGRTLWVGGTDITKSHGTANFNCSATVIDTVSAFSEIFYLLLVGAGAGFSVEKKHVSKLPSFNAEMRVFQEPYSYVKLESSETTMTVDLECNGYLTVGDSKEGWTKALEYFLMAYVNGTVKHLVINYNYVRPAGSPLKTFGGRASGFQALQVMFETISDRIKRCNGVIDSVSAMDICNAIAAAVICGGVRRSSQIALGDSDDTTFIEAKLDLFSDPAKEPYRATRVFSNNSIMLYSNPGYDFFIDILKRINNNGEPGFVNMQSAISRRPDVAVFNPCMEIALRSKGVCNLVESVVSAYVDENGFFDEINFIRELELASRMCSRITNVTLWHPEWDRVQKEDRLLGVSLTGIMSALNKSKDFSLEFLAQARGYVRYRADQYHDQMGIPRAKLITTIKPSGTLSQLPTVSSGIHQEYAPYYWRRIRVSKSDPIAKYLRLAGYPVMPENYQGRDLCDGALIALQNAEPGVETEEAKKRIAIYKKALGGGIPVAADDVRYLDWDFCQTWVFTFAVKTNATRNSTDESAIEQLERYRESMVHWTDHNTSVTITFKPDEMGKIAAWLSDEENWRYYVGVSFLPVYNPYSQMPYEVCTQGEYEDYWQRHERLDEEMLLRGIAVYENWAEEYALESDCSGGSCPVR